MKQIQMMKIFVFVSNSHVSLLLNKIFVAYSTDFHKLESKRKKKTRKIVLCQIVHS